MARKFSPADIRLVLNRKKRENMPVDDFRLLDSWAEYKEATLDNNRVMDYLCYEFDVMDPATGQQEHLYKAIKLLRILRLPRSAKESLSLMDMQSQVLTAVAEQRYNLITLIANVIKPENLGLLFLYGVQGVARTMEEAKEKARNDFIGLCAMLQGTYRVLEFRAINAQECEWLREKMNSMSYMTMVRGIPKANRSGEDAGNKGVGNKNINPDSQGTIEEMIAGMVDYEYVIQVLSTPVYMDTLKAWQTRTQQDMTMWNGQLQGTTSLSASVSIPMMYMANASQSQGWSHAYTDGRSVSLSNGESFTVGNGHSVGHSLSESFGSSLTQSKGTSVTDSVSHSQSTSQGSSVGSSVGTSNSFGSSNSFGTSQSSSHGASQSSSLGSSESFGTSQNRSSGTSVGQSQSHSIGASSSWSNGVSASTSGSNGGSSGWSSSTSRGTSSSSGTSLSNGTSHGTSVGSSDSTGESHSVGTSENHSDSSSSGSSDSGGINVPVIGGSYSHSWNRSTGHSDSTGSSTTDGTSSSHSTTSSTSDTSSQSVGSSESHGTSSSTSNGTSGSTSWSSGWSQGQSSSVGGGSSESSGWGNSISNSYSEGLGSSHSAGTSMSQSSGTSQSMSNGSSQSSGFSSSSGASQSTSTTQSYSSSSGTSTGHSVGKSESTSVGESHSTGTSDSTSDSTSVSKGTSTSHGTSQSNSVANGTSGTFSTGSSGSMGLAPSIGYNKSFQWVDQQVKDILEMLEFQNERIKWALRGAGAFYTYVYIACPSMDALSAAKALAKSTWQNEFAMVQPVQVLDLTAEEQRHLLYHFTAFSSDVTRTEAFGVSEYKYCSVLLPKEFVAYTHLPRISEGGIYAEVGDIPHFASPSAMRGDIYMGTILSAERYSVNNGYSTNRDYRIDEAELMHGYFYGASRSGKTVAAMRFVAELTKVRRKKTGKRLRIVCMDPKRDWRSLSRFVEPERFRFYSMGNPKFHPLHFNPCKIPHGVPPQQWVDVLIEIYCRAYGLLERGKQMMAETFYSLYEETGVFDAYGKEGWESRVPELSASVTFARAYQRMNSQRAAMEDGTSKKGRGGNDTKDAYARLLERLSAFDRPYSVERQLFGSADGLGIDDLIGADDVTVLESKGLESTFKNFIFGVITAGFYRYAIAHGKGFLDPDQYETVLVIEEANEVLTGNDAAGSSNGGFGLSGQSEFEEILDQSAGWGLFIFAITQKIADMPKSVIANAGLVFAGKGKIEDDINVIVRSIGKDARIDDRDIAKWFPRSPTGWFVCQSSRTTSFVNAEPVLVKIAMLPVEAPTDAELDEILKTGEAQKRLAS